MSWVGKPANGDHEPGPTDPAELEARALRRARTTMRRYAVRNGLSRLWTLTMDEDHWTDSVGDQKRRINAFWKSLRAELGHDVAEIHVVERGKRGTQRLHVHFAVGEFIDWRMVQRAWPHGNVHVRKKVRHDTRSMRERARATAGYLSKYIGKEMLREGPGGHRYEVAQGFQPWVMRRSHDWYDDAWRTVINDHGGEAPELVVTAADAIDYRGPPWTWMQWAG